nr:hypothetical protein CFP56_12324 [Quercus suber]
MTLHRHAIIHPIPDPVPPSRLDLPGCRVLHPVYLAIRSASWYLARDSYLIDSIGTSRHIRRSNNTSRHGKVDVHVGELILGSQAHFDSRHCETSMTITSFPCSYIANLVHGDRLPSEYGLAPGPGHTFAVKPVGWDETEVYLATNRLLYSAMFLNVSGNTTYPVIGYKYAQSSLNFSNLYLTLYSRKAGNSFPMPKNPPDERLVYLALRHEFCKGNALSKPKKIKERLLKPENSPEIKALVQEYNVDSVCQVAKTLLDGGVYHSTLQAKLRFPEIFEVSPAQTAERAAFEVEAARSENTALRLVAEGTPTTGKAVCEQPEATIARPEEGHASGSKRPQRKTSRAAPSLYPVYLPLRSQHRLLNLAQKTLEQACYEFGTTVLTSVLQANGWDCAEAVELNIWARSLREHKDKFVEDELVDTAKSFEDLLDSIAQLRHTAVHRLRVSATRLEQFMYDGESLCKLLHDAPSTTTMTRLRRTTSLAVDDLKRSKDLLETRIAATIQDFATRRAQLAQLEQLTLAQLLAEDRDCQDVAGRSLEEALLLLPPSENPPAAAAAAALERDVDSEPDVGSGGGLDGVRGPDGRDRETQSRGCTGEVNRVGTTAPPEYAPEV